MHTDGDGTKNKMRNHQMKAHLSILLALLYILAAACNADQESAAGAYKKSLEQETGGGSGALGGGGSADDGGATGDDGDEASDDAGDGDGDETPPEEVVDPAVVEAERIAALVQQAKPIYDTMCMGCHQAPGAGSTLNSQNPVMASQGWDQNVAFHGTLTKPSNDIFEGMIEYVKNPI